MQDVFDSIDPAMSGTDLAGVLNDFKAALMSGLSGPTRPTELEPGGFWVDTSNDPATWSFRLWTGSDDVEVFKVDLATGGSAVSLAVDSFTVRKVSADDVGPLIELVKRRIATSGQVKSGDVVGEIRTVGRQDNGANPVVAKIIFTAGEDNTSTAFGGTLAFWSTPVGQAAMVEHLKFIAGTVESVVAHKLNSIQLVAQSVATTATILQLDASKTVVEMTGATATEIHGINSGQATKQLTIHNRSSAVVTLKNQSASAAAADRLLLPDAADIAIKPQESATVNYSGADSRWKSQYRSSKFNGFTTVKYFRNDTFVVPSGVTNIGVAATRTPLISNQQSAFYHQKMIRKYGTCFSCGPGTYGTNGTGTTANASFFVQVVGGHYFRKVVAVGDSTSANPGGAAMALREDGAILSWGRNSKGILGDGTNTDRSSPVLVVGGRVFTDIAGLNGGTAHSFFGLQEDGQLYAWGGNEYGQLGDGTTVAKSSPVAVLGGIKFKKIITGFDAQSVFGLDLDNKLWAWGTNTYGNLGDGTTIPKSSPVAVLGGIAADSVYNMGVGGAILTTTGDVYTWGSGYSGILGDGTIVNKSSPVLVIGGHKFTSLFFISNASMFGSRVDGSTMAWGSNSVGVLGVGDNTNRSSPTLIPGLTGVVKWAAGGTSESCVRATNNRGEMYTWGGDWSGMAGVGNIAANRSTPLLIAGLVEDVDGPATNYQNIPVTPGSSLAISLTSGNCFLGSNSIGTGISYVEITYANP